VVGDEATIKVHVHTDDPDAAKALFAGAGRVSHEDIADMHEQVAGQRAKLGGGRSGVVAVASGDGMRSLFESLGATVVDGGPTLNPPTKDLLTAIGACPGEQVVVLPNSSDVRMAADEAARLAAEAGRTVVVAASESQQGGLTALVEFDANESAEVNGERLEQSLASIRVGAVAPAVKDDAEGRFRRGDSVGFAGPAIVAWGGAGSTLIETVAALSDGAEIVTVIEGAEAPISLDELGLELGDGVELELHRGGTANYSWLIAAQ
jgi:dihydroxyacetone kinase-like predicted kinase